MKQATTKQAITLYVIGLIMAICGAFNTAILMLDFVGVFGISIFLTLFSEKL